MLNFNGTAGGPEGKKIVTEGENFSVENNFTTTDRQVPVPIVQNGPGPSTRPQAPGSFAFWPDSGAAQGFKDRITVFNSSPTVNISGPNVGPLKFHGQSFSNIMNKAKK
jgi:hypothetical protein